MIVSPTIFSWFCTIALASSGIVWMAVDIRRLAIALKRPERDQDYIFGCIMGIVIMALGLIGVAKYHL